MARLLCIYLVVTGIGAALSLMVPALVVVGLFFILPGLILIVMPTAFLWGAGFAIVWFALRKTIGQALAAIVALAAAATFFWLAPVPSREASAERLAAAIRPDIVPPTPVKLAGNVRFDMRVTETELYDPAHPNAPRPVRCNALCAAVLFTEGVASVTLNPVGFDLLDEGRAVEPAIAPGARTFRLVPRGSCIETLRPTDAAGLGATLDEVRALEAEWNIRLSTRDCMVAEQPLATFDIRTTHANYALFGPPGHPDWSLGPLGVAVQRLEIRTGDAVVFRKLVATTDALARPLWINGSGSIENFRFGWQRNALSNAPRTGTLDPTKLVTEWTTLAAHADPKATAALVRERLRAMLADQAITAADPGWAAADIYFRQLKPGMVTDDDRDLVSALIRDRRMTHFDGVWDAIRGFGPDGARLRQPMVERLANPGPGDQEQASRILGKAIGTLPPQTFAQPTPA